jgi:hypothetical protein
VCLVCSKVTGNRARQSWHMAVSNSCLTARQMGLGREETFTIQNDDKKFWPKKFAT